MMLRGTETLSPSSILPCPNWPAGTSNCSLSGMTIMRRWNEPANFCAAL